ncbi:hypothetical protein BD777DRAFT_46001 [Yarrowia lipolytica]|nr:hypothetical protein BD777DRAFT_46001 [Yarrowia lipolytica]
MDTAKTRLMGTLCDYQCPCDSTRIITCPDHPTVLRVVQILMETSLVLQWSKNSRKFTTFFTKG